MSRGTAVFDKSTNRISSPAGTSTARVQRFPEFSRASAISFFFSFSFPSLLFFLPSFSLAFERTRATKVEGDGGDTFNKGKTRGVNLNIFSPFRSISATISFHLIYERVYTSYFSNRYNKDRKTQSIILDRDK